MIFLPIKPLSANAAWTKRQGGGFRKSQKYISYIDNVKMFLSVKPKIQLPQHGGIKFVATFGVCGKFDLDNCIKPFLDILQEVYDFNDNRISIIEVEKVRVKRNEDFIEFDLRPI